MQGYLISMLQCPACHEKLAWTISECNEDHVEEAEAHCAACGAVCPVSEEIGVFLTQNLQRQDLWEEAENELTAYLREHPPVEQELMQTPLEGLTPADRFFRALVLEEREEFAAAREAERMAEGLNRPIVATDSSPRVLRRDRRLFEFPGESDRVDLLAFDARRTPFKDGAVRTMTTNLGLGNIEAPGRLLHELRRVLSGELLAIMAFYPENDEENKKAIQSLGLEAFLYRDATLEFLAAAGFEVELANVQTGRALPTPKSELLEGAGIDALPVTETELTWCTLVAR